MTNYDDATIGGLGSGPRYPVGDPPPAWLGTIQETCIRNVALGRTASHSSVTAEMVAEWHRLNPGRVAR